MFLQACGVARKKKEEEEQEGREEEGKGVQEWRR